MMRAIFGLCALVLLAGCASDDDTPKSNNGHGRHHHNNAANPNASGTPKPQSLAPVSVPPGTVTNSPALQQGAVDAMGDPNHDNADGQ
jgi:hypothetical protein